MRTQEAEYNDRANIHRRSKAMTDHMFTGDPKGNDRACVYKRPKAMTGQAYHCPKRNKFSAV